MSAIPGGDPIPPPPVRAAAGDDGVVRIEITPRTLAWTAASVLGLWLLYRLWAVVLLLVVALVFAGIFNPLIEVFESRGHKRRTAMIFLIVALNLGAGLMLFLTVPALLEQVKTIIRDLPGQRERLIAVLSQHNVTAPLGQALSQVGVDQAVARLQAYLIGYSSDAVGALGYGMTTFFLSLYLLADGKRTQGAVYAVVPRAYHMRLARIIHNLEIIVGGYMRGQLITSVALAVFTFVLLAACGVRNALALCLLAALMDVIPFVGGLLATVPAVLTALGQGLGTSAVVLAGMCLYQGFENRILVPRLYGQALRLSPAAVVLALFAGGTLMGVVGALLALPIAAGLQMIVEELGVDLPGDDSDNPTERARDQKTEAAYELMSAGASAPDAGQIANELASGIREADAWVASQAKKKIP